MESRCECGDEISGYIKCGELLVWLRKVSFSRRTLRRGVWSMEFLKCSNQKVSTSCIISYIEGKYVPMVQKYSAYRYVFLCMFMPQACSANFVYFPKHADFI